MAGEYYIPGDNWFISDFSGQKVRRSGGKMNWKGQMVEIANWEPRQPQLTIRVPFERIAVVDARPEQEPRFLTNVSPDDL